MDKLDKLDILKEWYYKEEERKESLNNNINIQIGILTAIVAGLYFLATKYNFDISPHIKIFYIGILILSSLSWVVSIIFLLMAYYGYEYSYFPSANFIDDEYKNIEPYYNEYKDLLIEKGVTKDDLVLQNIEKLVKQCLDHNVKINDMKSGNIHRSKMLLFISISTLFLSSIFFIFNFINHPKEEIHSVKIIKLMGKDDFLPPPPPNNPPRVSRESHVPKLDPGTLKKTPQPPPPPKKK